MNEIRVIWEAKDTTAQELVMACAKGDLPFSGPNSLHSKFAENGWSTRYLYEAVVNAESYLKEKSDPE